MGQTAGFAADHGLSDKLLEEGSGMPQVANKSAGLPG